jgi:heterodisulfide reductase subunit B
MCLFIARAADVASTVGYGFVRAQARRGARQGTSDVLTACAACYLNTHGANEKIKNDVRTKKRVNEALDAAGLDYEGDLNVRHSCEKGLRIRSYGWQTC